MASRRRASPCCCGLTQLLQRCQARLLQLLSAGAEMAPERGRWGKRRRMVPPGMPGEVPGSPGVRGGGPSWVQIKFSPHNQPMFEGGAPPLGTPRGPQGQGVRAWGARPGKSWRPRGGPGGPGKGIIEKCAIEKDKCIIEKRTIEKSILARLSPPGGFEEKLAKDVPNP